MKRRYTIAQKVWGEFHGELHRRLLVEAGDASLPTPPSELLEHLVGLRLAGVRGRAPTGAGKSAQTGGLTMAGALQIGRDIVGVAKQTALGAIAANRPSRTAWPTASCRPSPSASKTTP